jgi:CRP/FNR family transcriptional regulator
MLSDLIEAIPLFSSLSKETLEKVASFSSLLSLQAGENIFYEGEKGTKLLMILAGEIQVFKTDPKGNIVVLHTFQKYDMVAEMTLFQNINYPASAKAVNVAQVLAMDFQQFEKEILSQPSIAMTMIRSLNHKIRSLEKVITQHTTMNAHERVIRFLLENEKSLGEYKQHQVATKLNIKPETLSRILKELKSQHIISTQWKNLVILNHEALQDCLG